MKFFPTRSGPPIYPKGQDTVEAFRDWAKDEIKTAVARAYDLGKFLFSVSATSLALLLALVRLLSLDTSKVSLTIALIAFGVSLLTALCGVVPRVWNLGEDTDIAHEYTKILLGSRIILLVWLISWSCGVIATAVLLGALKRRRYWESKRTLKGSAVTGGLGSTVTGSGVIVPCVVGATLDANLRPLLVLPAPAASGRFRYLPNAKLHRGRQPVGSRVLWF